MRAKRALSLLLVATAGSATVVALAAERSRDPSTSRPHFVAPSSPDPSPEALQLRARAHELPSGRQPASPALPKIAHPAP